MLVKSIPLTGVPVCVADYLSEYADYLLMQADTSNTAAVRFGGKELQNMSLDVGGAFEFARNICLRDLYLNGSGIVNVLVM